MGLGNPRVFREAEALGWLIDFIRTVPSGNVALVLNGDVFDFLARPDASYFDHNAGAQVVALRKNPEFRVVFDALSKFVATPQRRLIIAAGNHDIELALPSVQSALRRLLCRDDGAAGRLEFATDGTGYRCDVAGAPALFVHGNASDRWNVVDHDELSRRVFQERADVPLEPWKPNAGTRLVIDVMNDIKSRFAFVDILKPETRPVLAILSALDETVFDKLGKLAPILAALALPRGRREGVLGADADPIEGRALRATTAPRAYEAEDSAQRRLRIEQMVWKRMDPMDVAGNADDSLLFGLGEGRAERRAKARVSKLRESLIGWLEGDRTFALDQPDATFEALPGAVDAGVNVVAGHTHLARSIARRDSPSTYVNTGTWMSLARVDPKRHLLDDDSFKPVFDAIREGTVDALERVGLLIRPRPVARLSAKPVGKLELLSVQSNNGRFQLADFDWGSDR